MILFYKRPLEGLEKYPINYFGPQWIILIRSERHWIKLFSFLYNTNSCGL